MVIQQAFTLSTTENTKVNKVKKEKDSRMLAFPCQPRRRDGQDERQLQIMCTAC